MLRTVATLIPRPRPAVDPEPPPIGRLPGDAP